MQVIRGGQCGRGKVITPVPAGVAQDWRDVRLDGIRKRRIVFVEYKRRRDIRDVEAQSVLHYAEAGVSEKSVVCCMIAPKDIRASLIE